MVEDAASSGPSQSQVFSTCFFLLGLFVLIRAKPVTLGSVFLAACVSASAAVMWNGVEASARPVWPTGPGETAGRALSAEGLAGQLYGFVREKLEL